MCLVLSDDTALYFYPMAAICYNERDLVTPSIAKSIGCLQRRVFVCVCVFVCQHDNFQMCKHRMIKLGRCIVQKSRPSSNLGVRAPLGAHPQKCGVGLRCWENQRRLSSYKVVTVVSVPPSMETISAVVIVWRIRGSLSKLFCAVF